MRKLNLKSNPRHIYQYLADDTKGGNIEFLFISLLKLQKDGIIRILPVTRQLGMGYASRHLMRLECQDDESFSPVRINHNNIQHSHGHRG